MRGEIILERLLTVVRLTEEYLAQHVEAALFHLVNLHPLHHLFLQLQLDLVLDGRVVVGVQ